jgi:hypothetical protein
MVRVNLTIPDKGARLSVPPGWSHRSDDKGYLLVTPDYIPGCRMSFSFRSMPEGMPALAFIHHNAQKREARYAYVLGPGARMAGDRRGAAGVF